MIIIIVIIDQITLSMRVIVYDFDNLTVTVEWTQQVVNDVTYTPGVSPPPLIINESLSSQSLLLVLKYNTEYNLSVMANSCGVTATAIKTLYYGETLCNNSLILRLSLSFSHIFSRADIFRM